MGRTVREESRKALQRGPPKGSLGNDGEAEKQEGMSGQR